MSDDAISVLYPDDLPPTPPTNAPEWFAADQTAAAGRLTRRAPEAQQEPSAAEIMYPDDKPKEPEPPRADEEDPKPKSDDDVGREFQERDVRSAFNTLAGDALKEGETERAEELRAAETALVADFRAAGTDPAEFSEALSIINERIYEGHSAEQIEAHRAETMLSLQADYGPTLDADLNAARRFIADLEKIAPGTKRSLELSGAGNDPAMVRKAIREARRRGY